MRRVLVRVSATRTSASAADLAGGSSPGAGHSARRAAMAARASAVRVYGSTGGSDEPIQLGTKPALLRFVEALGAIERAALDLRSIDGDPPSGILRAATRPLGRHRRGAARA